ncbi:MAG: hypothetical protein GY862_01685 [Gammaproteobacteria bacterium]|nr:hypothetical protein [Gammaproteobacteria bacterium]
MNMAFARHAEMGRGSQHLLNADGVKKPSGEIPALRAVWHPAAWER